jgi:hypothetical protein
MLDRCARSCRRMITIRKRGMTSIELASTSLVLVVISMFSVDAICLTFGADFCDRACKDCARAAGQMSTPDDAVNAMNATAAAHPVDGTFFVNMYPELLLYHDNNDSSTLATPRYGTTRAYSSSNGPNNIAPAASEASSASVKSDSENIDLSGPYLRVRTTLIMRIPITITLFNKKLFAGNVDSDPQLFRFESIYTFPITNTYVPN